MCISRVGQIIYGVLAFMVAALILVSIFTPGWKQLEAKFKNESAIEFVKKIDIGLFSFACYIPEDSNNPQPVNENEFKEICEKWWEKRSLPEKIVIGTMFLALGFAVVSFAWNIATFFACCCKGSIFKPLPSLAGASAVLLGIAIALYYFTNKNSIENIDIHSLKDIIDIKNQNNTSYSFWLAVGAGIASVANVVVGTMIVCLADSCL